MSGLYPTKTRLALLRDVAEGEVWRNSNGEGVVIRSETLGVSDPVERCTASIAEMWAAGWVTPVELKFGAVQWRITDAGLDVLYPKAGAR